MSICAHDPHCPGHGAAHDEATRRPDVLTGLPQIRQLPALRRFTDPLARIAGVTDAVTNPLTEKPMNADEAEYVTKLKTIRRNAKKSLRSGNPAKRSPAQKVTAAVGPMLAQTYTQDAVKTYRREVGA